MKIYASILLLLIFCISACKENTEKIEPDGQVTYLRDSIVFSKKIDMKDELLGTFDLTIHDDNVVGRYMRFDNNLNFKYSGYGVTGLMPCQASNKTLLKKANIIDNNANEYVLELCKENEAGDQKIYFIIWFYENKWELTKVDLNNAINPEFKDIDGDGFLEIEIKVNDTKNKTRAYRFYNGGFQIV